MRESLARRVTEQVRMAVYHRKANAIAYVVKDVSTPNIVACLGPGRCMIRRTEDGDDNYTCPFCLALPPGLPSTEATRVQAFTRKLITGH